MSNRLLGIVKHVRGLSCGQSGAVSLEYAVLLGFILLGVGATLGMLGRNVSASTASISQDLSGGTGVVYVESDQDHAHTP